MLRTIVRFWQTIPGPFKFSLMMTTLGVLCMGGGFMWWKNFAQESVQQANKVIVQLEEQNSQVSEEVLPHNESASSTGALEKQPRHPAPGLIVGVVGMVVKPGLYELPAGSRVMDALQMAGGLSQSARNDPRLLSLNIARRLEDGETIAVGGETVNALRSENGESGVVSDGENNDKHAKKISINTATQSELESLPGIGPQYAKKMIERRPFISPQDMLERTEIPDGVLSKLVPLIDYGE